MMNAESSAWFWWSSLFALTAASGGIVLLVGLFWEKKGEPNEETFPNLKEYLSAKKIKKRGEILVIWGVIIEIATGFGFSVKEAVKAHKIDIEIAQTETNLTEINPLNQPISIAFATVILLTKPTIPTNFDRILEPGFVRLEFVGTNDFEHDLFCRGFLSQSNVFWKMPFAVEPFWFAPGSLVRDASKWNEVALDVPFLPAGTSISGGEVTLTLNSTNLVFEIPQQKAKNQKLFRSTPENLTSGVTVLVSLDSDPTQCLNSSIPCLGSIPRRLSSDNHSL